MIIVGKNDSQRIGKLMSQVKRKEANRQKPELKKMEKQMSSLHADTTG